MFIFRLRKQQSLRKQPIFNIKTPFGQRIIQRGKISHIFYKHRNFFQTS